MTAVQTLEQNQGKVSMYPMPIDRATDRSTALGARAAEPTGVEQAWTSEGWAAQALRARLGERRDVPEDHRSRPLVGQGGEQPTQADVPVWRCPTQRGDSLPRHRHLVDALLRDDQDLRVGVG